ncbi:hypothetical protein CEXT_571381 [Caerostris extrusa]|uniref:Uncharacterized protein n=1 Tax=Caerostris extrusa TaxID=172846 RepID=A0AAV4V0K7_CAEEX|nr:hypothetical protein CEXT_571381 [Caerostris extrusa]
MLLLLGHYITQKIRLALLENQSTTRSLVLLHGHNTTSISNVTIPCQPVPQVASTEYVETSASGSSNTKNRAKPAPLSSDNDRSRSIQAKPSDAENTNVIKYNGGGIENATTCMHPAPMPHLHPVLAKTLNGVTVMTYPNPVVMGNPAVLHVKNGNESDTMIKELGFLHPSIASGALTPPPTPLVSFPCDFNVNASVESFRQN